MKSTTSRLRLVNDKDDESVEKVTDKKIIYSI